jgi:hypothetical protein
VATQALYGSASVLLPLIGVHAAMSGVQAADGLCAALAPDLLIGAVVAAFVALGAAIRWVSGRRFMARPASSTHLA